MKSGLVAFLLAGAATFARADLGAALLAAYRFDGNGEDASGRGQHAQLIGATFTTDRRGNPNGALWLDGQGAYAATPVNGQRYPVAFSFWYRLEAPPGRRALSLVDSGIGEHFGHSFVIGVGGERYNANLAFPARFAPGQWQHVVVSYGSKLQVFIDGELAAERDYSEGPDYVAGNFNIGRHAGSDDQRFFHGAIDDVLIFNRALTADDARALFEGGAQLEAALAQAALARRAEAALEEAAAGRAALEALGAEPRPILVVAGPGQEPLTNAWAVFDGSAESGWAGRAGERGWWIAAEYHPALQLKGVEIEAESADQFEARAFVSETADEWTELTADESAKTVSAKFLLLTFTPKADSSAPFIKEVRPVE